MQEKSILTIKNQPIFKTTIPQYNAYRITPGRYNIEHKKTVEEILYTLTAMRENPIKIVNKTLVYDENLPIFYEIMYENKQIYFNYIMPDKYDKIMVNKIDKVFKAATIIPIEDYFLHFINKPHYTFNQKNHWMFSLNTDYRETGIIENLMTILANIDSEEDKIMLQFAIFPLADNWKEQWKQYYLRFKKGETLQVHNNIAIYAMDTIFSIGDGLLKTVDIITNTKVEQEVKKDERFLHRFEKPISTATYQKVNFPGYQVQIKLFCNDSSKIYYYAHMFESVFKVLDDNQEIELGKVKKQIGDRRFESQISKQIFSSKELGMFLQLPSIRIQMEYKDNLKSIENKEVQLPKELLKGIIPIGQVTYKGNTFDSYWPTNRHIAPMHKVKTGLQRTGKTESIKNDVISAIKGGYSTILIDTIKNCELANDIRDYMPPEYVDKLIVLDYSNLDYLYPLAWNELNFGNPNDSPKKRMMIASMVAGNFEAFLETVGDLKSDADKLSPRMKKYLSCACKLVMSQPNTTIKDVMDCLTDYTIRQQFITSSGLAEDNNVIQELKRLDDKEGTKYNEISGIIDRVSVLFNDYILYEMLSQKANKEIDFTKWANEGKCVLIKVSELQFSRVALNAIVTFLYSKIWLAMLARGEQQNAKLVHVFLDEIHRIPGVVSLIKDTCREAAKYSLSYWFTAHHLRDLKSLLPYFKASGASFVFFKTTKENYQLMKEELEGFEFGLEEFMAIRDYHTLNIINYDRDYTVFIAKVPEMVSRKYQHQDRKFIDLACSKKYARKWD